MRVEPGMIPVVEFDSDAGFRALVELSPDAVFVIAGGYHTFANSRGLKLLGGTTIDDLRVKPAVDFMHPDYRAVAFERLGVLLDDRQPLDYVEEKIVRLDGTVVEIEAAGTAILLYGEPAALVVVRDITGRRAAEKAVRDAEHRLQAAFRQAPTAMLIVDRHGTVIAANPALGRLIGRDHDELLGQACWQIVAAADRDVVRERWTSLIADDAQTHDGEFRYQRADSSIGWVYARAASLGDDHAYVIHLTDVTASTLARQHLARRATRDSLTGLPNRSVILDRLHGHSAVSPQPVALLFLDLDGFKQINDQHGHHVGDAVLTIIGRRLQSVVADTDIVGRLGGDEFAVIITGSESAARADAVAERIQAVIAEPILVSGMSLRIGVSIGVAHSTTESHPAQLLSSADAAMYRAKAATARQPTTDPAPA
ncbi:diguanylate cyclase (GGDEF)-like protein/PAS domain S-box-containing protein [Allocatelliglobosispora scoriae]|uniref:Diguanylate cyclase (GGDEF)-like protein/PAS domain S-box-containing protein n=1 Tax=Allocatelliglobosispora scoriae TaxID=643052 RepID=A0A841BS65_9ACTN|nr:diguanylate cyclase [Allocatelliglobosispora scoriae]MBB5869640.1 diguanylate cyclase (GGDEF)-like protein/PAS domain S-box-containing protein [Allocatelliglobosispora scoriae]